MSHLLYNDALRRRISGNLAHFERRGHDTAELRHSAVVLAVVPAFEPSGIPGIPHQPDKPHRAALILTRRTPKLNRHSGQWALPGGRIEQGETAAEAALRELEEEVGLAVGPDAILGQLDDFTSRSGFVITPLVVWGGEQYQLCPDPGEVRSMHLIPIDEFLRRDAPRFIAHSDDEEPVLNMPIGFQGIYAPTGALLFQFREVAILGNDTRVAHYEQPRFAWK